VEWDAAGKELESRHSSHMKLSSHEPGLVPSERAYRFFGTMYSRHRKDRFTLPKPTAMKVPGMVEIKQPVLPGSEHPPLRHHRGGEEV